jgi:hypothetical protein
LEKEKEGTPEPQRVNTAALFLSQRVLHNPNKRKQMKTVKEWLENLKDEDRQDAIDNIMPLSGDEEVSSLSEAIKRINWGEDFNRWVGIHDKVKTNKYFSAPQETPESIKAKGIGRLRKVLGQDNVNHPDHYTAHPSGIECIEITEHMNFCLGNAVKYIWRADLKDDAIEDLQKAAWYINREIERRLK